MQAAVLIRLRPLGPWRSGPGDRGTDQVEPVFGSDRLFSAVTLAMRQLGMLDEWLDATARRNQASAVAFTSLFPFGSEGLFAPPPATLWPPPAAQVTAPSPVFLTKMRWNAARFVPVTLVESILLGQMVLADQWVPDPQTGCLLRRDRPSSSPFRLTARSAGAVDRVTQAAIAIRSAACLEFETGAGLWTVARYADEAAREQWSERVEAAFRLLGDTGFGGRRSSGWGQTAAPEFQAGSWPGVLMPKLGRRLQSGSSNEETTGYWLLSLYSPSAQDGVDWTAGDYALTVRNGFVHATGQAKKAARLVAEGSVVVAASEPLGAAVDVAPEGASHPVYRSGLALALRLPVIEIQPTKRDVPVETTPESDLVAVANPEPEAVPTQDLEGAQAVAEGAASEPEPTPKQEPVDGEEAETAMPTTGEPEAGLAPPESPAEEQPELDTEQHAEQAEHERHEEPRGEGSEV